MNFAKFLKTIFTNATLKELFSCIFALLKQRQHCRHIIPSVFMFHQWLLVSNLEKPSLTDVLQNSCFEKFGKNFDVKCLQSHFTVKLQVIYMQLCKERAPLDVFFCGHFCAFSQNTSGLHQSCFLHLKKMYDLSTNFITKTNLADKAWFSLLYPAEH